MPIRHNHNSSSCSSRYGGTSHTGRLCGHKGRTSICVPIRHNHNHNHTHSSHHSCPGAGPSHIGRLCGHKAERKPITSPVWCIHGSSSPSPPAPPASPAKAAAPEPRPWWGPVPKHCLSGGEAKWAYMTWCWEWQFVLYQRGADGMVWETHEEYMGGEFIMDSPDD